MTTAASQERLSRPNRSQWRLKMAMRLARGLAHAINIYHPDVTVLGGGLSKLYHLYGELPELVRPHIFADAASVSIVPPKWGDSSGVRGAAWLART